MHRPLNPTLRLRARIPMLHAPCFPASGGRRLGEDRPIGLRARDVCALVYSQAELRAKAMRSIHKDGGKRDKPARSESDGEHSA